MSSSGKRERYYRQVTESVVRFYIEFEDGVLPGAVFDPRVLDYRIDVERAMRQVLSEPETKMLLLVHKDGVSPADAVRLVRGGSVERPDRVIARLEVKLGRIFARKKLLDLQVYLAR